MMVSDRMSKMMIDYLVGERKYKKFAAIYQDDEYGQSFRTSLAKDLARHGIKRVATEPVKHGDTDVRAKVAKLQGVFFFQAEDGIRDLTVTGVQTCALPI